MGKEKDRGMGKEMREKREEERDERKLVKFSPHYPERKG